MNLESLREAAQSEDVSAVEAGVGAADTKSPIFETRLERALEFKDSGNVSFAAGEWETARALYGRGLFQCEFDEMQWNFELMDDHRDKATEVRLPLLLNSAAATLKLGDGAEAERLCSEALKLRPDFPKALFRRGQALELSGKLDRALVDLAKVAQAQPADKAVRAAWQRVASAIKEEDRKAGALWQGKLQAKDAPATQASTLLQQEQDEPVEDAKGDNVLAEEASGRPLDREEAQGLCNRALNCIWATLGLFLNVKKPNQKID